MGCVNLINLRLHKIQIKFSMVIGDKRRASNSYTYFKPI
jgi:hypothetical protein